MIDCTSFFISLYLNYTFFLFREERERKAQTDSNIELYLICLSVLLLDVRF